jgi:PAS domain S-box-containing protein
MEEAERIFEMSPDMICVAGMDGRFKAVNPAFERTLGYSRDELLARPFMDFVHPDDRQATSDVFGELADGAEVTQFENRYISKDGVERWLQWSYRVAPDQSDVYAIAREVTQSRRITGEQAALRRVATLAARESSPADVLGAVAEEAARVLEAEAVGMLRFEPDGTATLVAQSRTPWDPPPLGSRFTLDGDNVVVSVHRTGRAARMDDWGRATGSVAAMAHVLGVRSSVATPIVVEGRLWGTMIAATSQSKALPADAESRIGTFTELVVTAISNAESREALTQLADEQAALRRVATLVAQGAPAAAVFDAVAAEMERLLGADGVTLSRYEPDDALTFLAHRGTGAELALPGTRLRHTGKNVASKVRRTQQAARVEDYRDSAGAIAQLVRDIGVRSAVGAPIMVEGRLWGVTVSQWRREVPPADTEERMVQFAELLGMAIANADSRDQLTASRARLLTEADEARRRVVRDLHDGAQQRLVHAIVTLKLAQAAFGAGDGNAEKLVGDALGHAERGIAELRELAHGILPAVLTHDGLRAGLDALVERLDLPVKVDLRAARLAAEIEASAYFIVAEALTNVMKHSRASHAEVTASVEDDVLLVDVRDDGVGGADATGHGLVGMADRVTALGGQLTIDSPADRGTHVRARFPLSGVGPA